MSYSSIDGFKTNIDTKQSTSHYIHRLQVQFWHFPLSLSSLLASLPTRNEQAQHHGTHVEHVLMAGIKLGEPWAR